MPRTSGIVGAANCHLHGDDGRSDFQTALAKLARVGCYLAIVNRNGAYQLWQHTLAGTRLLNQAILDIEELLADPKPTVQLVDPNRASELPAILLLPQLPLRLSHEINKDSTWEIAVQRMLTLTRDGRLLRWDDPKRGAKEVLRDLPTGRILACAQARPDDVIELLVGSLSSDGMHVVRLTPDVLLLKNFPLQIHLPTPREAIIKKGIAWIFSDQAIVAVSTDTGAVLDRKKYPPSCLPGNRRGLYLATHQPPCNQWRAISFDGQEIVITDLGTVKSDPQSGVVDKIELVFDTQSEHGPVAMLRNGMLYFLESRQIIQNEQASLADRPWRLRLSRDGQRLSMNGEYLFDLDRKSWKKVYGSDESQLEPRLHLQTKVTMWSQFENLLWHPPTQRFGLTNRRGKICWFNQWLGIEMHNRPMSQTS